MNRIRGFDGLRALAVLLVFIDHKAPFAGDYAIGTIGVRTFFVLSGFLIIGILAGQRERIELGLSRFGSELKTFLFRRTLRIFPIYYLFLAFMAACLAVGALPRQYLEGLPFHLAYLSNFYTGALNQWPGPFGHLWSLAIEEQFYLLFAPALLLVSRATHLRICAGVIIVGLASTWAMKDRGVGSVYLYTHSLNNFCFLALGGAGYHLLSNGRPSWLRSWMRPGAVLILCVATIVVLVLTAASWKQFTAAPYTTVMLLYGLAVAGVVFWVVRNNSHPVVAALEHKWLVSLGRVSYSFYLFHLIVPDVTKLSAVVKLFGAGGVPYPVRLASFVLMFFAVYGASRLSWHFIEQPILRLRERRPKSASETTPDVGVAA